MTANLWLCEVEWGDDLPTFIFFRPARGAIIGGLLGLLVMWR